MARILITQHLLPGGLARLRASSHELVELGQRGPLPSDQLVAHAHGVQGILCLLNDRIDAEILSLPGLRAVATVSVGTDNIDLDAARRFGVAIVNTPGVLDAATADLAVMLMLATRRRTSEAEVDLRAGRWTGWSLDDHLGDDLTGATVGLVGYGRIATAVERRLAGFDARVLHHTRSDTDLDGWRPSLLEMAREVDVLSVHVPLTPTTRGLIDDAIFDAMPSRAVLVNTARGQIVDEAALIRALASQSIAGAGLDVFDGEPSVSDALLASPGTVLLPHIGSATTSTRLAMCDLATQGLLGVLAGETPVNLVS